jgi:hypothetical protein
VFVGLLQLDPTSYLATNPNWVPTLPRRNGLPAGNFTMVDLLTFARVDPNQPRPVARWIWREAM